MSKSSLIYSQLIEAIESHTPCILASVIHTENSTSATVGDKALVDVDGDITGWIGGGCCQTVIQKLAPQLLKENKHCVIRVCPKQDFVSGMHCYPSHCPSEGTVDIFLEPIANQQVVLLYGNTPIAQSIARYSDELNINLEWRQFSDDFSQNMSNSRANITIIATQGVGDFTALGQALADKAEHILLIASSKKAQALKDKLKKSGICSKAVDKIIAPAGIDIGASTSPEIALSVMAKVVSLIGPLSSPTSLQKPQPLEEYKTAEGGPPVEVAIATKASSNCCGGS